jgi:uncharacterized membrane protein
LGIHWSHIPDEIPSHYTITGEIDRWGNKARVVLPLFVMAWILYGIMVIAKHFTSFKRSPQYWKEAAIFVPEAKKEQAYRVYRSSLDTVNLLVAPFFMYLTINATLARGLPPFVFLAFVILVLGTAIFLLFRTIRTFYLL